MILLPPISTLFPYTTLFRSHLSPNLGMRVHPRAAVVVPALEVRAIVFLTHWAGARRCRGGAARPRRGARSEEHTSELQSQSNLVCRLLLEKKKKLDHITHYL